MPSETVRKIDNRPPRFGSDVVLPLPRPPFTVGRIGSHMHRCFWCRCLVDHFEATRDEFGKIVDWPHCPNCKGT